MPDIEPIGAEFDGVAGTVVGQQPHSSDSGVPTLPKKRTLLTQPPLDVDVEVEGTIGTIEMGVLQNSISYLTPAGLEEAAGVAPSAIFDLSQEWEAGMKDGVIPRRSRISFFHQHLSENGYSQPHLYIETSRNGAPYYVYPDIVCMAFLEYFAFEAPRKNARATENYRNFARAGFQEFVYKALGYTPPEKWKYLHDRVSVLNGNAPESYFTVYGEVSTMIVELINADLLVSEKTVPEMGVEKGWSDHWSKNCFDDVYGARVKHEPNGAPHPHAASNPPLAWAYPNEALAEFRRWFRHEYLTARFPRYVLTRAHLLSDPKRSEPDQGSVPPKSDRRTAGTTFVPLE